MKSDKIKSAKCDGNTRGTKLMSLKPNLLLTEVGEEYQNLLQETEENQKYWEEYNRERFARIAKMPPPPGMEAAWEKLQREKAKLDSKA